MTNEMTVADVLERVRERRRALGCPDCDGVVSIRGFGGEHCWECLSCAAVGIGYESRAAASTDVRRRCR